MEMTLQVTSHPSLLFKNPRTRHFNLHGLPNPSLSLSSIPTNSRFYSVRRYSSSPREERDRNRFSGVPPIGKPPKIDESEEISVSGSSVENVVGEEKTGVSPGVTDEWGERTDPEAESSYSKLSDADPPKDEDEWGGQDGGEGYVAGNGTPAAFDKLGDLKRCLVDTVYGTQFGYRASAELRAEVFELINQLEAANPTPAPTEATSLLDGNWVLLYTAFSELLPLLAAAGTTPFLKVTRISQAIDSKNLTIKNSTSVSNPFATFSFSAAADFEVRSPSRIQVRFKEGILQPPEIRQRVDLPDSLYLFGQSINLAPVQQSLNPLQELVASISRTISGQQPLKVPIPGDRSSSWLLITYLDEDFLISRGDGGIFVLAKEGSALLDE